MTVTFKKIRKERFFPETIEVRVDMKTVGLIQSTAGGCFGTRKSGLCFETLPVNLQIWIHARCSARISLANQLKVIAMRVADLIEQLKSLPPNMKVILQEDAEGNGYSPLYQVNTDCIYEPLHGEIVDTRWTAEEAMMGRAEWEEYKASHPCCCLLEPC